MLNLSVCFGTGSRRLLTYRRKMVGDEVYGLSFVRSKERVDGGTADDLNNFRKRVRLYIQFFYPIHVRRRIYILTFPDGSTSKASNPPSPQTP